MEGISNLPRLVGRDLPVWDTKRSQCGGFLFKKASESSKFSKGKWQKRWFIIKIDLSAHENYTLQYYYSPDETTPRQVYSLEGAKLDIGVTDRSLDVSCLDGTKLSLSAETDEVLEAWSASLKNTIDVATARGKVQKQRRNENANLKSQISMNSQRSNFGGENEENSVNAASPSNKTNYAPQPSPQLQQQQQQDNYSGNESYVSNNFQRRNVVYPTIRLDIDTNSMPPGSTERHQFEEMLINDIQKILKTGQVKYSPYCKNEKQMTRVISPLIFSCRTR